MADEDYEILPHKLLEDLKFDVEALKKKITAPDAKINELILEIESLKDSIHELNDVFKKALVETKEEDLTTVFKTIHERLQAVVSQNETIAKGMIAISDKLEEWMKGNSGSLGSAPPGSVSHTLGPPQLRGSRMAPHLSAAPPSLDEDMPPPPPGMKRPGLFK